MGAENGRREKRKKKERKMKKRGREWTKREGGEALDSCRFESAEGKLGRWRGKFTATSIKTVNFPGPTRNIRRRVIDTVSIGVPDKRHDPSREARQRRCAASTRRGIGERGQRAACCKKFALESKFNLDHSCAPTKLRFPYPGKAFDPSTSSCFIFRFFDSATRSLGPSLRPPAIVPFPNDTIAPFPINGSTPLLSPSVVSSRFIVNNPNVLHLRMYKLVYAAWELCCFACSPDKPDGNEIRLEGSEVGDRGSRLIERGACMCACVCN